MKSQRSRSGISLVSRQRTLDPTPIQTSNNSPAKQPPILQRKRSSEYLAAKKKPIIRTQPSESDDFRLEVRHNPLDEETNIIHDIIGHVREETSKLNTLSKRENNIGRSKRKHQIRNSSAPRLLTAPSESYENSPRKMESVDRRTFGETSRKTFRVDINLEEMIREHKRKTWRTEPTSEIESIFAKGIRKKLLDIEKGFMQPGLYPTPTFRKKLVETNLEALKGKLNSFVIMSGKPGKQNIVFG